MGREDPSTYADLQELESPFSWITYYCPSRRIRGLVSVSLLSNRDASRLYPWMQWHCNGIKWMCWVVMMRRTSILRFAKKYWTRTKHGKRRNRTWRRVCWMRRRAREPLCICFASLSSIGFYVLMRLTGYSQENAALCMTCSSGPISLRMSSSWLELRTASIWWKKRCLFSRLVNVKILSFPYA